jgi:predicted acylesterase/phospholipase RssA
MRRITSLSLLLTSLLSTQTLALQDSCHAIVLSGGGNKGAYEAGVVYGLAHSLPAADVTWDVVSGVSAGALNAGGIGIFAVGDELNMADWLVNLWETTETKDIWVEWTEGILWGMFNESGIFDDTPLLNLLTSIISESPAGIQRKMIVSTVDTLSGAYLQFDETTPIAELPQAIISSASIPAVFPDQQYKGYVLMDGGTTWNTNLVSAVEKCMTLVDDKSKITVDIAICGHAELETVAETGNTISNLMRYWDIRKYYNTMDDVLEY